jgi:hypothetical protein
MTPRSLIATTQDGAYRKDTFSGLNAAKHGGCVTSHNRLRAAFYNRAHLLHNT